MRTTFLSLDEKHYQPARLEHDIYALWENASVFNADPSSQKPPYTIVIPPPNVTGRLHMGHALNNSVQDALIRFKRMDGFDALWVPGTDHAGISTQSVVKKHLDAEGINYLELGREKMIARIWEWKKKYGDQILLQLRRMGCSCDWSKTAFTMDENLSVAVRTAFKKFYDDGLIYRGKYIVNWCPVDRTALSDDEVSTAEGGEPGHLWHFKYPLADGSQEIIIATTRPETMLGDSAVAVNPQDERYQHLIGKMIRLPIVGREIPIIADDYVDKSFGSGGLKVTPAHDPNDFQIARRHNLPYINVMNEDATMGDQAPAEFHGMDRFACREVVVEKMKDLGLLVQVEDRMTPVGRAQRSGAVIEYRLSDQWFVKMRPLADQALARSDKGELLFTPERWDSIYRYWLENTQDWCISRQIWWGHQIPAWYNRKTGEIAVDVTTPAIVAKNPDDWYQDQDVLDTWFSSALWPFSTLGWPEQTAELARYYPTSVLSTAKDIIYFWVARMVMTGVHLVGKVPFNKVYLHPVVCDARGETMSKSKGNGIDPLHVIDGATVEQLEGPIFEARPVNMQNLLDELHLHHKAGFPAVGADALRLTLLSLNSQAQQVQISLQKFEEVGKRFVDKIWNASRFVLQSIAVPALAVATSEHQLEDRWILSRLDETTDKVRKCFEEFQFNAAVDTLQTFFWDDFCDWYVELVKTRMRGVQTGDAFVVQQVLSEVLLTSLRLLHPIIPFVTEELWGHTLNAVSPRGLLPADEAALAEIELIAKAPFPVAKGRADSALNSQLGTLQELVRQIRYMRSNAGVASKVALDVQLLVKDSAVEAVIRSGQTLIERSANIKSLTYCTQAPVGYATAVLERVEVFANLDEHLDVGAERERNQSALKKVELEIEKAEKKLNNPQFMERAPEAVREKERQALADAQAQRAKLLEVLAGLGG